MTRGWWADHLYTRRSVSRDIEEFPGWPALLRLVEACESDLERAFIATLFSCGSRVSEALRLRDHSFEAVPEEGLVIVRGAPLLKRYRKLGELPGGGWETAPVDAYPGSHTLQLCLAVSLFGVRGLAGVAGE